jgi:type IV secretory pathway component VirB8
MEEPNNYSDFDSNYRDSIKYCVNDGSYFKDAFDWYCNKYLRPIVDRTFFIFMSIMGVVIVYNVVHVISLLLPIKDDVYISIVENDENDLTKYQVTIKDLSKSKGAKSTDEDILEYLILNYVKERESHNYKIANIDDVNLKFTKIKNTSSPDVFDGFKYFMSADYNNGPYYYFGKNVQTTIRIDSFSFIRINRGNFIDKVIDYFSIGLIPVKAEVFYTLNMQIGDKTTSQNRKVILSFKFNGVEYDERSEKYLSVRFIVTSYKNYMLKS